MGVLLPVEAVHRKASARGLGGDQIERCVAAIASGRNICLIAEEIEHGVALAEAIAGTATETGACLGALTMLGSTLQLLEPSDLIRDRFQSDLWLIVRSADARAITQVAHFSDQQAVESGWRAVVVSNEPMRALIEEADVHTRNQFAYVALTAA